MKTQPKVFGRLLEAEKHRCEATHENLVDGEDLDEVMARSGEINSLLYQCWAGRIRSPGSPGMPDVAWLGRGCTGGTTRELERELDERLSNTMRTAVVTSMLPAMVQDVYQHLDEKSAAKDVLERSRSCVGHT